VRRVLLLLSLAPILGIVTQASAQDDAQNAADGPRCRASGSYLAVALPGEWAPGSRGAVVAELEAALEVQGFDLCLVEATHPRDLEPVAVLTLEASEDGAQVRIEVRDAITDKYVERRLRVTDVPADTRPLAVAIAADELVRASWAELLLEDAPEPAIEPPPEVRAVVQRQVRHVVEEVAPSAPVQPTWLSLQGAFDYFGEGERQLGASLAIERWMHPRLALRFSLGGRAGMVERSSLGSVHSRALPGALDLLAAVVGAANRGPQLVLGLGTEVRWVRYRTSPVDGALGVDDSGVAAYLRGLAAGRWSFGVVRVGVEVWVGAPLAAVAAHAGGQRVVGVAGVGVGAVLALGVRL